MPLNPLNHHYAMENPASVYDEEALTALQLAGRTTAKVNETVAAFNQLKADTNEHLEEQDKNISQRMQAQDDRLTVMFTDTMPKQVTREFEKNLNNGTFEAMVDSYAGDLEGRVDTLLGTVVEGSTTMDAEVIDARMGEANLGVVTRKLSQGKANIILPMYKRSATGTWDNTDFIFKNLMDTGMVPGTTYMLVMETNRKGVSIKVRGGKDAQYNGNNSKELKCNEANGRYYYYTLHTPIAGENGIFISPLTVNAETTSTLSIYENVVTQEMVHYAFMNYGTIDGGVSENAVRASFANYAENSAHSSNADMATIANKGIYAEFAMIEHNRLTNLTVDDFSGMATTIDSVVDGVVTATGSETWSAPYYKCAPLTIGQKYLVIWQGGTFWSCALINKTSDGWFDFASAAVEVEGEKYYYAVITPNNEAMLDRIYWKIINATTVSFKPVSVTPVFVNVTAEYVASCIKGNEYNIVAELEKLGANNGNVKNVLFMGDSLTAANQYQATVCRLLNCEYENHALGGAGLLQIVDGNEAGTITPLTAAKVADKDLIVFYAGYNNRGTDDGKIGDCYKKDGTGQATIAGYMQYCINRIYDCLTEANNLTCKVLIVTVDCSGKYPYRDVDGYGEYPAGTGRTMETMANIQRAIAEYNSIPCCDLWHNSGINRHTWCVFGAQSEAYIENPTNTSTPYPHNGDQLHKSSAGYKRIGECIAGAIIKSYGK